MKNKKIITALVTCFSIMLVIVISVNVFVWRGIDIAARNAPDFHIGAQDGKVYFTNKHNIKATYCYDTQSGKLSSKRKVTAVGLDGVKLITDDYIFVHSGDFYAIDKKTEEKTQILALKEAREKDGFADEYGIKKFEVGEVYQYGAKIYFYYSEKLYLGASSETREYFAFFDMETRTLEKFDFTVRNYLVKNGFLYYVKIADSMQFLCCINLDTSQENYYEFAELKEAVIGKFVNCKNGIAFLSDNSLENNKSINYFDITTKEFFSVSLDKNDPHIQPNENNILSYCEEQDSIYLTLLRERENGEGSTWWFYGFDLSAKELVTVSTQLDLPVIISIERNYTPIIWIGNKGYIGAYGTEPSHNDSFAFCSVDSNGNVETILYKDRSLERKIFQDYVDEKHIVKG